MKTVTRIKKIRANVYRAWNLVNFANVVNFSFLFFIAGDDLSDDVRTDSLGKFVLLFLPFFAIEKEQSRIQKGEEKWWLNSRWKFFVTLGFQLAFWQVDKFNDEFLCSNVIPFIHGDLFSMEICWAAVKKRYDSQPDVRNDLIFDRIVGTKRSFWKFTSFARLRWYYQRSFISRKLNFFCITRKANSVMLICNIWLTKEAILRVNFRNYKPSDYPIKRKIGKVVRALCDQSLQLIICCFLIPDYRRSFLSFFPWIKAVTHLVNDKAHE